VRTLVLLELVHLFLTLASAIKTVEKLIMNALQLRPEDCSAFGVLILQYLEQHPQTNMSQLARQVKISRAGLGWICRKDGNPDEETASKIARIIGADLKEVARLVHENKLAKLANLNNLNYATKFSKDSVRVAIPKEDAIAGLNLVYRAFHTVTKRVSDADKPTEFQIYKHAYEVVKRQFLSRQISRQQLDSELKLTRK
jgi:DNA-binding phage protein